MCADCHWIGNDAQTCIDRPKTARTAEISENVQRVARNACTSAVRTVARFRPMLSVLRFVANHAHQ